MRFILNVDQALAVTGLMICAGFGWAIGRWIAERLLRLLA
jgi:hypothetical protein